MFYYYRVIFDDGTVVLSAKDVEELMLAALLLL